jgi:acetyl esterase/lipase
MFASHGLLVKRFGGATVALACCAAACCVAGEPRQSATVGDVALQKMLGPRAKTFALWPEKAPDEPRAIGDEEVKEAERKPGTRLVQNVTEPTMTLLVPENAAGPVPAFITCPGGGYGSLGFETDGAEVVKWLNKQGYAGIVLKYRVPKRNQGFAMHHHALQDAQRAMGLVRQNAPAWNIDPKRVGIIGFSAGGHLAAALSNNYDERIYKPVDEADAQSCKPDVAVLVYPAYLTNPIDSDERDPLLKTDQFARNRTPPTFIAIAQADKFSRGAIAYFRDLSEARVPGELHIYDGGGHGNALRAEPLNEFAAPCARWLKQTLEPKKPPTP